MPETSTEPTSEPTQRRPPGRPRRGYSVGVKAQIIACLVEGMSVREAARAVGVRHDAVYSWLKDDLEFQDLLAEAEARVVDATISQAVEHTQMNIRALGPRAYERLSEALEHESARVYLPAVGYVLRYLGPEGEAKTSLEQTLATLDASPTKGD